MKKTMFITSVIMVVVMAIALTTSSLAWFTVDGATTVSTSPVSISAKANASEGLYISNDASAWQQGALTIASASYDTYLPVVPYGTSSSADAADLLNGLQNDKFVTNTVKVVSGGTRVWANGYSVAGTNFYKDEAIYVANAGDAAIAVSAAVAFTDVHGAKLNVAVLAKHQSNLSGEGKPANSDWVLIALANSNGDTTFPVGRYADTENMGTDQYAQPIVGDGNNDYFQTNAEVLSALELSVSPSTNLKSKTTFNLARKTDNYAAGEYMQVKVLAWYSQDLNNQNSGSYYTYDNGEYTTDAQHVAKAEGTFAKFTVTFSKEPANA